MFAKIKRICSSTPESPFEEGAQMVVAGLGLLLYIPLLLLLVPCFILAFVPVIGRPFYWILTKFGFGR